ncbi:MAG: tryptophan synthase subunit alpha [Candidatus Schekmanbacteria bacterium]|nr:tryptophan synthase subunit alpha [Candidatus Schekmanbacteria bacterium]
MTAHETRLATVFRALRRQHRAALVPYVTAGYPSLEATTHLLETAAGAGADVIEVGYPFSDPMADGPVLQRAHHAALTRARETGHPIDMPGVLAAIHAYVAAGGDESSSTGAPHPRPPVVLMTYYNPVFRHGIDRFVADAVAAGLSGAIIPDLPPEEARALVDATRGTDFSPVFLLAPTSTVQRIREVAELTRGFIYLVSVAGVTGIREAVGDQAEVLVRRVRRETELPVAVGFGISTPEQVARIARIADGAVVGSALMSILLSGEGSVESVAAFAALIAAMRAALGPTASGAASAGES